MPDTSVLAALAIEYGDYRASGYSVERYGPRDWILRDPTGAQLMIGNHGGLSPRKADAIIEAYARIASDRRAEALMLDATR